MPLIMGMRWIGDTLDEAVMKSKMTKMGRVVMAAISEKSEAKMSISSRYNRLKYQHFLVILTLLFSFVASPVSNLWAAPSPDQVRAYVKVAYGLTDVTDQVLDSALAKSPISGSRTFLDIFGYFMTADTIINDLYQGNYTDAIAEASKQGLEWAISDTFLGQVLSSPMSVANLSTVLIKYSLNAFVDQIEINSWNTQIKLYIAARQAGMTHDAIMQGNDDNSRAVFFNNGWIFSVGDLRVPPLGQISPTGYTTAQVYGSSAELFNAVDNAAYHQRDKDTAGTALKKILNPGITFSPSVPVAPADVFFTATTGDALAGLSITSYAWDFGDGQTGSGASVSHYYKNPATYAVTLTMTDSSGGTHIVTASVPVQPPPITVTYPDGYDSLYRQFSTVDNSHITQYTWNFGDGTPTKTSRTTDHTYASSGSFTVTLTLTLDDNTTITSQVYPFVGPGTRIIQGHTIYGDETWYSGGTYEVQGNITVAQGATLTIEPGVTVKSSHGVAFNIYGTLRATSVKFTWAYESNYWIGIRFSGSGSNNSRLDTCEFEYATGSSFNYGVINIIGSSPTITGCTLHNSPAYGIWLGGSASPLITDCSISGMSGDGIHVSNNSFPTITGSKISGNGTGIFIGDASGGTYNGNIFSGNAIGALILYSATTSIYSNDTYINNSVVDLQASGTITGNVTWNGATQNGAFHTYPLTIADGSTLAIPSGGTVKVINNSPITVYGTLKATGVRFTWYDGQTPWQGLLFVGSGTNNSRLENCVFEHAAGAMYFGLRGALSMFQASPTIIGCTINNTNSSGIYVDEASAPLISNSTISGQPTGIYVSGNSSPTVTSNTISNNQYGIYNLNNADGIYTGNTFSGNSQYGLYCTGSTPLTATNNNWGDPSGPLDNSDDRATGGLYNPTGLGNRVSDHVNYYPWTGTTITQPTTPTGLSVTPGNAAINIAWNAASNPDIGGYKIYYGTSAGTYTTPVIVGNITSYKLTGLIHGATYYIAISSINSIGAESAKSSEIRIMGGTITGRVTNTSGTGITGVSVCYSEVGGNVPNCLVQTQADGSYTIAELPTGSYKLQFSSNGSGYITQWYNNKASSSLADAVSVTAWATTGGINATLIMSSAISGQVTTSAGVGIAGVYVSIYSTDAAGTSPQFLTGTQTDASGNYSVSLPNGYYKVLLNSPNPNPGGLVPLWNGGYDKTPVTSPVVTVASPATATVNATMLKFGISGKVTDSGGITGISGAMVSIFTTDAAGTSPQFFTGTQTDESGNYSVSLSNGYYKVLFIPPNLNPGGLVSLWNGGYDKTPLTSPVVTVASPATATVNATMLKFGISGKVTDSGGITGISGAMVSIFTTDAAGTSPQFFTGTQTDESGNYSVSLSNGYYKVLFIPPNPNPGGLLPQWNGGYDKTPVTSPVVTVMSPATATVNASLLKFGIAGKVTDSGGVNGISGVSVQIYSTDATGTVLNPAGDTLTDASGNYSVSLLNGNYKVLFYPPNPNPGSLALLWNGGYDKTAVTSPVVTVAAPETTTINAALVASPSSRIDYAQAYFPSAQAVIMHGGWGPSSVWAPSNEVWKLDATGWTLLSKTGSPAMVHHSMTYDSDRGVLVMCGGVTPMSSTIQTWEFDGITWTRKADVPNPGLIEGDVEIAFDENRKVTVLYLAGITSGLATLEYNGTTWSAKTPLHPPVRHGDGALMKYDAANKKVVLVGEASGVTETWTWDGADWTQIVGTQPQKAVMGGMVYDTVRGEMVLLTTDMQTWVFNGSAWTHKSPAVSPTPSPLRFFNMAFDAERQVATFFGGESCDFVNPCSDPNVAWDWNGTTWAVFTPQTENRYTVAYSGNGSTGGTPPADAGSPYLSGATVTVLGNTGSLTKTGYTFAGWNAAANGSGTSYAAGATFAMGGDNVILYAQWTALPAISGNAGIAGATLGYTDGVAKTVTADANGNYSFSISYNWSGIVTPAKSGYTFSPASKSYTNVIASQTAQNYSATPVSVADTAPPTITTFTIPATSSRLLIPVTFFAATDNTGVTQWCIVKGALSAACSWQPYPPAPPAIMSFTFPTGTVDGLYTLSAFAKDAAGNVSQPVSRAITIDTVPPTLTVTPANITTKRDSVYLSGVCEANSTITAIVANSPPQSTPCQSGKWGMMVTGLHQGVNLVQVSGTDLAGNSTTRVVRVNKQ